MIGYRDMTFCTQSDCVAFGKSCHRSLTEDVKKRAEQWWGGPGAPISVFGDIPECFVDKNKISDNIIK